MKKEATTMEVAKFDVAVVYKTDDECHTRTITQIPMSEIQVHVPPGAELISVVAKRHPNHQLK
jgi:hypothetical protein